MIKLQHLVKLIIENLDDDILDVAYSGSGLISPTGSVYPVSELEHLKFLVKQPKYIDFKNRLVKAKRADDWATIYRAVLDDALDSGWIRIASRSNEVNVNGRRDSISKRRKLIDDIVLFIDSVKKRHMNVRWEFV